MTMLNFTGLPTDFLKKFSWSVSQIFCKNQVGHAVIPILYCNHTLIASKIQEKPVRDAVILSEHFFRVSAAQFFISGMPEKFFLFYTALYIAKTVQSDPDSGFLRSDGLA